MEYVRLAPAVTNATKLKETENKTILNNMKVDVLLGLQWGDEGKGKVVDVLTPRYDVVARFQGGPNAGHTLEFEGKKYVLRSIPSGIFQHGQTNIIGNGVVLDPVLFREEAESLEKSGVDLKKILKLSKKIHLIMPTHRLLDAANEKAKGGAKIGTTGKGIGPTYTDKISRNGLRLGDVYHNFDKKYAAARDRHVAMLRSMGEERSFQSLSRSGCQQSNISRVTISLIASIWSTNCLPTAKVCFAKARRVPCLMSTSAAIRLSLQVTRYVPEHARVSVSPPTR